MQVMVRRWNPHICLLIFCFLTVAVPNVAVAQINENNTLQPVLDQYANITGNWAGPLTALAVNLFILLATLELAYTGIRLALEGAELQAWIGEFIQRLLFIGLFLLLLLNGGFASTIVDSFRQAAGAASGFGDLNPLRVFELGLQFTDRVLSNISFWRPGDSLGLLISGLILMIAFALMAALLMIALIEMFILINAGIFLLGFGGNRFTKDFAVKFMTYAVSVGAKLFVMQLTIGLGLTLLEQFLAQFQENDNSQVLVMIGISITFLALVRVLPDMVQSIINGIAVGGSGGLWGAAAQTFSAGAIAAGAVTRSAASSGMAVREAAKLASAQGQGGIGGTTRALSGAVGRAAADKVAGVPGAQFAKTGGLAIQSMRHGREKMQGNPIASPTAGTPAEAYISPIGGSSSGNK